jgi:hypothetical protein
MKRSSILNKNLRYFLLSLIVIGTINGYSGITVVTVNATNNLTNDGKATITVTEVAGNYEYKVDNGTFQASNSFGSLSVGNHTATVKEKDLRCEFSVSFMIVGNTLPVTIIDFLVRSGRDAISVKWKVVNEIRNRGYEVQRSDKNGSRFTAIGWVNGINGIGTNEYEFSDRQVEYNKEYFYRIKQVDNDGKEKFSNVEGGKLISTNFFKVFPNPARKKITILSPSKFVPAKCVIKITNVNGVTLTSTGHIISQNSSTEIDISSLASGSYFAIITSNNTLIFREKFSKL